MSFKINGVFMTLVLGAAYYSCEPVYFHEPSYIDIKPHDFVESSNSAFGFSLGYQSTRKYLVVGAPRRDLDGKVYLCPLEGVNTKKSIECSIMDINIDELAVGYTRSVFPHQNFFHGASIATTADLIFTCAPLVTANILESNGTETPFVFGTCFITNSTKTYKYKGMFEKYMDSRNDSSLHAPEVSAFFGGVGWSTLADEANNAILIANRPSYSDSVVQFIRIQSPLDYSVSMNLSPDDKYKGCGMASGKFFAKEKSSYAISAQDYKGIGLVTFNSIDDQEMNTKVTLSDKSIGTLFGTVLHAVDVNGDAFSDLIVGAPTYSNDMTEYEVGAIHIYLGGGKGVGSKELCISGTIHGSRFGSSITSADLDEDNHPEIFVGAPYEDLGNGAIYIISGFNLDKILKTSTTFVRLSTLSGIQRISNSEFKTFGFSLQPVLNITENDESPIYLAVGSPGTSRVALYRSIPSITVDVKVILPKVVRPGDLQFTVTVKIDVTYPLKSKVSGELLVSTKVSGDGASILNHIEVEKLSIKNTITKEYVVNLANNHPGYYAFNTTVYVDEEIYKRKDFSSSIFKISDWSTTSYELPILRFCEVGECVARLMAEIKWSGKNTDQYELGSTSSEVVEVIITNEGKYSYDSCIKIKITGTKVNDIKQCSQLSDDDWYKCDFAEIKKIQKIPISLNMNETSNLDKELKVDVEMFNKCESEEMTTKQMTIPYILSSENIYVEGSSYCRNLTDRELEEVTQDSDALFELHETYSIVNNKSVTWKNIQLRITLNAEDYIKEYKVSVIDGICTQEKESDFSYLCTLDVDGYSKVDIVTTINVWKSKIKTSAVDNTLEMTSKLELMLHSNVDIIEKTLNTTMVVEKDTSFGENKGFMVLISAVGAVLILIVVIAICYLLGFFKRKEKTKLNYLKMEIHRRESIKRPPRAVSGPSSTECDINEKRRSTIIPPDKEQFCRNSMVLTEESSE